MSGIERSLCKTVTIFRSLKGDFRSSSSVLFRFFLSFQAIYNSKLVCYDILQFISFLKRPVVLFFISITARKTLERRQNWETGDSLMIYAIAKNKVVLEITFHIISVL